MKIIGYVLLGLLALLLLLLLVPLGAEVRFGGAEETRLFLRVGPLRIPPEKLKALKKEKKAEKPEKQPAPPREKPPKEKKSLPKFTLDELFDLLDTALHALGKALRRLCRGVHFDPLELCVTLGGDGDPSKLAENYGYVNAALWTFMPRLEALFTIPDPCIAVNADFEGGPTRAEGRVGVRLRLMTLVIMLLVLAWPLLGWYRRYEKAHKNDPLPEPESKSKSEPKSEPQKTEEKLSA